MSVRKSRDAERALRSEITEILCMVVGESTVVGQPDSHLIGAMMLRALGMAVGCSGPAEFVAFDYEENDLWTRVSIGRGSLMDAGSIYQLLEVRRILTHEGRPIGAYCALPRFGQVPAEIRDERVLSSLYGLATLVMLMDGRILYPSVERLIAQMKARNTPKP